MDDGDSDISFNRAWMLCGVGGVITMGAAGGDGGYECTVDMLSSDTLEALDGDMGPGCTFVRHEKDSAASV